MSAKYVSQQTSLDAYRDLLDSGDLGRRQEQVYQAFRKYGPATNLEISKILGLPINQITPRNIELREKHMIREISRRKCNISNRTSIAWGTK